MRALGKLIPPSWLKALSDKADEPTVLDRLTAEDEQCGCRSKNECCAPGFPGCRTDELPWSLERDLRLVGDCEKDCLEQCQGVCGVDHIANGGD